MVRNNSSQEHNNRRKPACKIAVLLMAVLLCCLLCACGKYPSRTETGQKWDQSWEMLGLILGVEEPGSGLKLLENDSVLTGDDTYYASWVAGNPVKYTNQDDREIDLYPVQLHVLVYGCGSEEFADNAILDFQEHEAQSNTLDHTEAFSSDGITYDELFYVTNPDTNPYDYMISAYTRYDRYAVVVELTYRDGACETPQELLEEFLEKCHYSRDLLKS